MKRFICENVDDKGDPIPGSGCGEVPYILMNGYCFGERVMEDVMFRVEIKNDEIVVSVKDEWPEREGDPWEKCSYLFTLNKDYWMQQALEYAQDNDIATCPKCGQDIDAQPQE